MCVQAEARLDTEEGLFICVKGPDKAHKASH